MLAHVIKDEDGVKRPVGEDVAGESVIVTVPLHAAAVDVYRHPRDPELCVLRLRSGDVATAERGMEVVLDARQAEDVAFALKAVSQTTPSAAAGVGNPRGIGC